MADRSQGKLTCLSAPFSRVVFILTWTLALSETAFIRTNHSLELLAQRVNFSVSQLCSDDLACRGALNSTTCLSAGVCTEIDSCNGRTDFPPLHRPLRTWQMTGSSAACVLRDVIPDSFDSRSMFEQSVRNLYINGSSGVTEACNARRDNVSEFDEFTLTFWLSADCTNCSVLELSRQDKSSIHIRVVDGMLCVSDQCFTNEDLENGSWTFLAAMVYAKKLTIYHYVGATFMNKTSQLLHDVDIESILFGSSEVASPGNEFTLFDVRFYGDVLTTREFRELQDGLKDITSPCKCPPSHPIFINDSECQNEAGDTYPRFNPRIQFNPASVLLDPSNNMSWASADTGNVSFLLSFSQTYEVESVSLEFSSDVPKYVSISWRMSGAEDKEELLQCSDSKCEIYFQQNISEVTVSSYKARLADEITITLIREDTSVAHSFILDKMSVTGRCDCNGNAETCNVIDGAYDCQCKSDTNSDGDNCKLCKPGFFKEASDFSCPHECSCSLKGVVHVDDPCEESGGQCICKELVTGPKCSQCKEWTYGFDQSKDTGCSPCACSRNGSVQCDVNSGECTCKSNTEPPNCDSCITNHYGFDSVGGCRPCDCQSAGTKLQNLKCDTQTGQCECKDNVEGLNCEQCKPGFFDLSIANDKGCSQCECHPGGTDHSACNSVSGQCSCNSVSGQCSCRNGIITDRKCSPTVSSIDPRYGPEIGGTRLTIKGKLLGNSSVYLGGEAQQVRSRNDSVIIVDTIQGISTQASDIELSWQGMPSRLSSGTFSYRANPVLDVTRAVDVKSYISGGCLVNVYGTNLKSVKYPRLDVINKARPTTVAQGECRHFHDYVTCYTPDVHHIYNSAQDEFQLTVVLDGVTSSDMGNISFWEDPVLKHVGNIRFQYPFETTITLHGKNLNTACQQSGVAVLTLPIECEILSMSSTHIKCEPTSHPPKHSDKRIIEVRFGKNSIVVGTLEYLELHETTGFIIIASCVGGLILLIVIIIVIVCFCRRYRRRQRQRKPVSKLDDQRDTSTRQMNTYSEITQLVNTPPVENGHSSLVLMENVLREPKKGIVNSEAETSLLTDEFLPYVEPGIRDAVNDSFIGESSFTIGPCRKTGQYTKLMDGTLKRNGVEIQKLSIKSLSQPISGILRSSPQSNSGPTLLPWANYALSECLRLRHLRHNHIISCHGIGMTQKRFHLLYSYSKQGTLKDLVSDSNKEFSVRQLLGFSQQVSGGIAYLASKNITHKDVAARNCMVDDCSVVKIGDASFSWDFYPKEYVYNEQRERYLPVRWMAPESLTDGYYDMRSDVWSFGVLVWELLTRGCLPFHEVSDAEVTDYVLNGYVLGKPETISDKVYELLRKCWSPENETRPSMASLSRSLSYILESENEDTYANGSIVSAQKSQAKRAMANAYNTTQLSHV